MKTTFVLLLLSTVPLAVAVAPPEVPEVPEAPAVPVAPPTRLPDGFTALLAPVGSLGGYYFETADLQFEVSLYEKDAEGAWAQVARQGTARVAVYDAEGEHDVFSQGFTSTSDGRVTITIPGELVNDQTFDVWITIWRPDESYPTSHYSLHKNMLILRGEHDAAEAFDYHHALNPYAVG